MSERKDDNKTPAGCHCPYCDAEMASPKYPFCGSCAEKLTFCPHCGEATQRESKTCRHCGRQIK